MPHDHKTLIYIILSKDPGFTGIVQGVDFYNGWGSTSSLEDAARFIDLGYMIEGEGQAIAEHLAANREDEERLRKAARVQSDKAELLVALTPLSPAWRALLDGIEERKGEHEAEGRKAHKSARWKHAHNYYSRIH